MSKDAKRPCKGCTAETGRFPSCHADCPRYKAAKEADRERKEAEKKEKIVRNYIADEVVKAKRNSRKGMRDQRGMFK